METSNNPWVTHAVEILSGKFDKCDDSTACSLIIGLRSQPEEICQRALKAIVELKKIKRDINKI